MEAPKPKATPEGEVTLKPEDSVFVERYPHFGIIAKRGKRIKGKTPSFLSSKQFVCPKCGKIDYGNVNPERVVMCSYCVLDGVLALEQRETEELKNGGREDGRKVEGRSSDFRDSFIKSTGSVQVNFVSVQAKRPSVVKTGREGILSRIDLHGVDSA